MCQTGNNRVSAHLSHCMLFRCLPVFLNGERDIEADDLTDDILCALLNIPSNVCSYTQCDNITGETIYTGKSYMAAVMSQYLDRIRKDTVCEIEPLRAIVDSA